MEPFSKLSSANKRSAEIVAQIKAHLLNGTLKPGDKLPTEEELVEQFGVSRTPIREAIKTLEAIGIVQINGRRHVYHKTAYERFSQPIDIQFAITQ